MSIAQGILSIIGIAISVLLAPLALILLIRNGYRERITITNVCNGTGRAELEASMADVSANFRLVVEAELERVRKMVLKYHRKVQSAPDRCYGLELPDMRNAVIANQDDTLASLLTSLDDGARGGFAGQLQAVAELIVQSRSVTVTAILHQPDQHDDRLGIAVEVACTGHPFARSRLLWEADRADPQSALPERIKELIQPAARCVAIDLASWVLRRRARFSSGGGRRQREGLAENMAGLLMKASSETFARYANYFLRFARDEFLAAADKLPQDYQPHFNLAAVHEVAGKSAAGKNIRYGAFMSAVREYRVAERLAGRLPDPAKTTIKRTIKVRMVRTELVSDIARLKREALTWLWEQRLKVELDCRTNRPRLQGPIRIIRPSHDQIVLDGLTSDYLYNSACMYAIAASITRRPDWDHHARRLLGTALVIEADGGGPWTRANNDPDLRQLAWHLPEFMEVLREARPDSPADEVPLSEIVQLVDDVAQAACWRPAPGGFLQSVAAK